MKALTLAVCLLLLPLVTAMDETDNFDTVEQIPLPIEEVKQHGTLEADKEPIINTIVKKHYCKLDQKDCSIPLGYHNHKTIKLGSERFYFVSLGENHFQVKGQSVGRLQEEGSINFGTYEVAYKVENNKITLLKIEE